MTRRKTVDPDPDVEGEAGEIVEEEVLPPTDEELATTIGIESGGDVSYRTVPKEDVKERRLLLDGQNYEHVSDDAYGRWIFRTM